MTTDYAQQASAAYANVFGSTLAGSFAEPLSPPNFRWIDPPFALPKSLAGKIGFWECVIDDLRGPQAQDDKFDSAYAGWSSGTLDCRFRDYAISPLKTTYKTFSSGSSQGNGGFFGVNFGSTFVMAQGSGANISLAKETSTSDPTPVYVTYSPGSAISGLGVAPIGGTTSALRLFILREAATVDVHSAAGTSQGTMHANLSPAFGMALSPVNAATPGTQTIGFLANGGIWTLPITAAIGAAPTQVLSNLPNGGTMLGFETLEKSPYGNRCYMLLPEANSSNSAWYSGTLKLRVAHVNVEFVDLEWIETDLAYLIGGRLWQHNLVLHDYTRVLRYDGERAWDLNIFTNIAADSNIKWTVEKLGGSDTVLRALVQRWDMSSASASTLQWWEFMPQTNSWTPVSELIVPYLFTTVSDGAFFLSGLTTMNSAPYLPWSKTSGACFISLQKTTDQAYAYQLVPPQGVNPYNAYRKTGATDYASKAFTAGTQTLPKWTLPHPPAIRNLPLSAGHPLLVDEIDLRLADVDGGGTSDAYVSVALASQARTSYAFPATGGVNYTATAADPIDQRRRTFYDVLEPVQKLQVKIGAGQDTGQTNKTSNALPIILRGHVCFDDIPRTYNEIRNAS